MTTISPKILIWFHRILLQILREANRAEAEERLHHLLSHLDLGCIHRQANLQQQIFDNRLTGFTIMNQ